MNFQRKIIFMTAIEVICLLFCVQSLFADQFPAVVEAEVKAIISAEREGVLTELHVDAGDRVKKGEVLANVLYENLVIKKRQLEDTHNYLAFQVDNLTKLNAKGLSTDEELAKAKMEMNVNEKEIKMIQYQIDHSEIRAPFSGIIVARLIQAHEWVRPGQSVIEMYDADKLRIVADIPSDIAVRLSVGQTKSIFFPDLNKNIDARVKVISPQVEVRSNTVKVYWSVVSDSKSRGLLPGMKGVINLGRN